jgi:hypothetical protein
VPAELAAGRYFSNPADGCYWERQSGFSGTADDVIANEFVGFDSPQIIVDVRSTDAAFDGHENCGTWFTTPRPSPPVNTAPPGTWLVGPQGQGQVQPGTYRASTGAGCYWERTLDFSGHSDGRIANKFTSAASVQLVTIASSDVGFKTYEACGTWVRLP